MLKYDPTALRRLRLERGWTVETLAARARLGARGLRNLERNSIPSAATLGRLASALGVPLDAFYRQRVRRVRLDDEQKAS